MNNHCSDSFSKPCIILFLKYVFVLTFLLIISFYVRWNGIQDGSYGQGIEASWHNLLTTRALQTLPLQDHRLLPVVTLGGEHDRGYPWGAAVPMDNGVFVYTSFTSPAFLLSWFWFSVTDLPLTLRNLAILNFILHGISTFILFRIVLHFCRRINLSTQESLRTSLIAVTVMIFSREALLSHGLVYWSQSLYQPLLFAFIFLCAKTLTNLDDEETKGKLRTNIFLAILAFLGAWTEWTGFVTNSFATLFFWYAYQGEKRILARKTAIYIFIGTVLAGILILGHLLLFLPLSETIVALVRRAGSRSAIKSHDSYLEEFVGSYGLFIVAAISVPLIRLWEPWFKDKLKNPYLQYPRDAIFLAGFCCIPLVENLLLLQHATEFSFDRLKATLPISIIIAFSFAVIKSGIAKHLFVALIILASILNINKYHDEIITNSREWKTIHQNNIRIRDQISEIADISSLEISTNGPVRGYLNFLFQRSITGRHDAPRASSGGRPTAFLDTAPSFRDLTEIKSAKVVHSDGSTFEFRSALYPPEK